MRQKALYVFFIFIMALFLILVNKKAKVSQPVLESKNQQTILNNESPSLLGGSQPSDSSSSKPGVTPIRKAIVKNSSEESILPPEKEKPVENASVQNASSSDASVSESSKNGETSAKEESSGITKTSKSPAAKEKQQLRDKGVLLL